MSAKRKIILAVVIVVVVDIAVLTWFLRKSAPAVEPSSPETARYEEQYREMTEAYPIASEMPPGDPTVQLWQGHKAALVAAGYIEAKELQMSHSLAPKGAVQGFFAAFHARFPGVELSVGNATADAPLVTVTARKSDFGPKGAIERFVTTYVPTK